MQMVRDAGHAPRDHGAHQGHREEKNEDNNEMVRDAGHAPRDQGAHQGPREETNEGHNEVSMRESVKERIPEDTSAKIFSRVEAAIGKAEKAEGCNLKETLEEVGVELEKFAFDKGAPIEELAHLLFKAKDMHFRLVKLKERTSTGGTNGKSGEVLANNKKLVEISLKLKVEASERLALLIPTLEKLQGITFNWGTAAVLARLSLITYDVEGWKEDKQEKLTQECKKWIADDELRAEYIPSAKGDNAAIVVVSSSTIFLVFRGTASGSNWCQNLTVKRVDFPIFSGDKEGKVHKGFYFAQESLWELLEKSKTFADSLGDPKSGATWRRSLYIGGHSLGGAMAIITAARLASTQKVKRIDGVYTFGSPALFDRHATQRYNEHSMLKGRTFRVENDGDLVTSLLTSCCCFLHPGHSLRIRMQDGKPIPDGFWNDACCVARSRTLRFFLSRGKAHGVNESYWATADSMAFAVDTAYGPLKSTMAKLEKEERRVRIVDIKRRLLYVLHFLLRCLLLVLGCPLLVPFYLLKVLYDLLSWLLRVLCCLESVGQDGLPGPDPRLVYIYQMEV